MKQRTVLIVPGGGHSPRRAEYRWLAAQYRKQGITPIVLSMPWGDMWSKRYVSRVQKELKNLRGEVYLFGFSWGAVAALLGARNIRVAHALVCSISPMVAEYRYQLEQECADAGWLKIPEDYLDTMAVARLQDLAPRRTESVDILLGEKEIKVMKDISTRLQSALPNSRFIVVPWASHDINSRYYKKAIAAVIRKL